MRTEEAFVAAINADPTDNTKRLAYADWLEENGHNETAAHIRTLRRPVHDITVEALQDDYDWGEVFGEGSGGNCDKSKVDACPPGADIDVTPPNRSDVVEVIAAVNGENDGPEWIGVFRLRDGRILLAAGSCDYTGWDCQAGNSLEVAANVEDMLAFGIEERQYDRLWPERAQS